MRSRVEQSENRVGSDTTLVGREARFEFLEDTHPQFDIVPLESSDMSAVRRVERPQIAVLYPNQVGLVYSKVGVEFDEARQGGNGILRLPDDLTAAFNELPADIEQHRGQDGSLAGEMLVDRWSTGPTCRTNVFNGRAAESSLRKEPSRLSQHAIAGVWGHFGDGSGHVRLMKSNLPGRLSTPNLRQNERDSAPDALRPVKRTF
jgi:hypothetical protein